MIKTMYRVRGTRHRISSTWEDTVEYIQIGQAADTSILGPALALYEQIASSVDLDTPVSIRCKRGVSGCKDYYNDITRFQYIPEWGLLERTMSVHLLHVSMSGKLNDGLTINRHNFAALVHLWEEMSEGEPVAAIGNAINDWLIEEQPVHPDEVIDIGHGTLEWYQAACLIRLVGPRENEVIFIREGEEVHRPERMCGNVWSEVKGLVQSRMNCEVID